MEGVAGVDEVRGTTAMFVGQEAGSDNVDVGQPRPIDLGPQRLQHHGRDVDRDHSRTGRRDGERELPGARPDLDDHRLIVQAKPSAELHLGGGSCVLLRVVARDVVGVEVLSTALATSSSNQSGVRSGSRTDGIEESCQPAGATAWHLLAGAPASRPRVAIGRARSVDLSTIDSHVEPPHRRQSSDCPPGVRRLEQRHPTDQRSLRPRHGLAYRGTLAGIEGVQGQAAVHRRGARCRSRRAVSAHPIRSDRSRSGQSMPTATP